VTPLQQRIAALLDERAGAYHRIPLRLDTTRLAPHQAACRIAAWTEMPGSRLDLALPPGRGRAGASSILIGRGILSSLGLRLREAGLARRVLVFIAAGLREIFETQIAAALEEAGCTCDVVAIRDGDAAKDLEQVTEVIDALAQRNAARDAVAVGVGGGVTGDLVGLSASLYMRGIPLVLVPTTLLAQVDAGIGGKVGVNHRHAKNLIGGFYLPHLVLIDPCALRTLPDSELSSGMAEVIKTALVGSPSLYEFLAEHLDEPEGAAGEAASGAPPRAISTLRRIDFLERCVIECAAVKAAVVERDPLEAGERRVLNLGHTTAHALETVAGYRGLTHGQAVAVGLAVALRIATQRGMAAPPLLAQARRMLRNCGLPLSAPQFDEQAFAQSLRLDKKARTGSLHFVLPVSPGVISVVDNVGEQDILAALRDERDACSQEAQP
jgi:3-dehydroquinate synthase